jgi:diguanylate cyclase (GGDEF)-like protein/PAS domain S-box-containing protein
MRRAQRKAESELRLRTSALEATANAVVITDRNGTIDWVNPAFCVSTGYAAHEVVGQNPRILKSGVHPEAFYRKLWATVLSGDTWRGEVFNRRKDGSVFLEEMAITPLMGPEGRPTHFIAIKQDITERKKQESEIRLLSTRDLLTGLPNQGALRQDLTKASERARVGARGALLFLDLDRFALVNDSLGHAAGDHLLMLLADRVSSLLPPDGVLYRFGGDEFAVLLPGLAFEGAMELAEAIRKKAASMRYESEGRVFDLTVSIGAVLLDGSKDDMALLAFADSALRTAKEQGRNRVVALKPGDQTPYAMDESSRWAARVKDGLRQGHLELHLQPIVRISDGSTDHCEALVRLRMPDEGRLAPPGAFLPAAAAFGLMPAVDEWVVTEGIQLLAEDPSLRLHVNISAQGLGDEKLLEKIALLVEESRLASGRLGFEITETAAISDFGELQRWAARLKAQGCTFAIDDFGTGFSSFAYLRTLPVDLVKIDGSFIKNLENDPTNQALVRAMVTVAHALGREVVAEMVETAATAEILRDLGVEYGQGWFWGRPAPVSRRSPSTGPL